jgi:hypothetical protein
MKAHPRADKTMSVHIDFDGGEKTSPKLPRSLLGDAEHDGRDDDDHARSPGKRLDEPGRRDADAERCVRSTRSAGVPAPSVDASERGSSARREQHEGARERARASREAVARSEVGIVGDVRVERRRGGEERRCAGNTSGMQRVPRRLARAVQSEVPDATDPSVKGALASFVRDRASRAPRSARRRTIGPCDRGGA